MCVLPAGAILTYEAIARSSGVIEVAALLAVAARFAAEACAAGHSAELVVAITNELPLQIGIVVHGMSPVS